MSHAGHAIRLAYFTLVLHRSNARAEVPFRHPLPNFSSRPHGRLFFCACEEDVQLFQQSASRRDVSESRFRSKPRSSGAMKTGASVEDAQNRDLLPRTRRLFGPFSNGAANAANAYLLVKRWRWLSQLAAAGLYRDRNFLVISSLVARNIGSVFAIQLFPLVGASGYHRSARRWRHFCCSSGADRSVARPHKRGGTFQPQVVMITVREATSSDTSLSATFQTLRQISAMRVH